MHYWIGVLGQAARKAAEDVRLGAVPLAVSFAGQAVLGLILFLASGVTGANLAARISTALLPFLIFPLFLIVRMFKIPADLDKERSATIAKLESEVDDQDKDDLGDTRSSAEPRLEIQISEQARRDALFHSVKQPSILEFIRSESQSHPEIYRGSSSTSIPLIMGNFLVLISSNNSCINVERLILRSDAYPFFPLWLRALSQYRMCHSAPYRQPNAKFNSKEFERSLTQIDDLIAITSEYLDKSVRGATVDLDFETVASAADEAHFHYAHSRIPEAQARLEAALSHVHKLLLSHIPGPMIVSLAEPASGEESIQAPREPSLLPVILVVEDDDALRGYLNRSLSRHFGDRYQVLTARNGREALRHILDGNISLLLTDVVMPHVDGIYVARAFRAKNPLAKIIILTGFSNVLAELTKDHPDVVVLSKPIHLAEFNKTVEATLSGRP